MHLTTTFIPGENEFRGVIVKNLVLAGERGGRRLGDEK